MERSIESSLIMGSLPWRQRSVESEAQRRGLPWRRDHPSRNGRGGRRPLWDRRILTRLSLGKRTWPPDGLNFLVQEGGTLSCSEGGSLNWGWDRVMVPAQSWAPCRGPQNCATAYPVIPLRLPCVFTAYRQRSGKERTNVCVRKAESKGVC